MKPLTISIKKEALSIVGYLDAQLSLNTSCAFKVDDATLSSNRLLALYPPCKEISKQ